VLAEVSDVIEMPGLQIGLVRVDLGEGGLSENIGRDILDNGAGDFVNEADIPVFTGNDARNDLARVISGSTTASRPRRP